MGEAPIPWKFVNGPCRLRKKVSAGPLPRGRRLGKCLQYVITFLSRARPASGLQLFRSLLEEPSIPPDRPHRRRGA
jgi:hypothetical protein